MTEHKFTDDEKILALLKVSDDIYANAKLTPEEAKTLLDLIKRYKAEIERLISRVSVLAEIEKDYALKYGDNFDVSIVKKQIKAEAIKEFAERLKEKLYGFPTVYNSAFRGKIDDLVKEMTGDATEPAKVSPHEICVVCGDQVPEGRQVCYMCETGQEFLNKKKE